MGMLQIISRVFKALNWFGHIFSTFKAPSYRYKKRQPYRVSQLLKRLHPLS